MKEKSEVKIEENLEQAFDRVADLYDIETTNLDDVPFFVEMASKTGGPVLELAAGTGRVAIELAKTGFDVVGLDISPRMLEIARRKTHVLPQEQANRLEWVEGDMTSFDLPRKFKLIFITFRSFQALLNRAEQSACLECIARHLEPEGRLVIDLFAPSYELIASRKRYMPLGTMELDGKLLTRSDAVSYDWVNQLLHVERVYDITDAQDRVTRKVWKVSLRYIWRFEMELLLENAGFETEALYGYFDKREYEHDGEMIFVARRKQTVAKERTS
jgi:ubiquinone/menaquinone biosynthesis C-methylase UbiE